MRYTSQQQHWIEKARKHGAVFATRARQYDEEAAFPEKDFDTLREEGYLNLPIPEKFGGPSGPSGNCNLLVYSVVRELAKYSSSTAWNLMIHYHQSGVLARLGSDEQRSRIFTDVMENGALMGSLGSETNPTQMKADANIARSLTFSAGFAPTEGGFTATGEKHFCSMAPAADYLLYWALAPGTDNSGAGLVNAIVPRNSPGLTLDSKGWDEVTGLRATISWSARLDNVFIPWENVLGQPGDFVQNDPYTYELSQAAHLIGTIEGAYNFLTGVLRDRPYLLKDDSIVVDASKIGVQINALHGQFLYANSLWEQEDWGPAAIASIQTLHNAKNVANMLFTTGYSVIGTRALFKFHNYDLMCRDMRTASLHTRESQLLRLSLEGSLSEDYFPKIKYGYPVADRADWKELGFPEADARP